MKGMRGPSSPKRLARAMVHGLPMLRWLHGFALAFVTVLVCAGMMSAGRGSVSVLATARDRAALESADSHRPSTASSSSSQCFQSGSEGLSLDAVESNLDEEDPLC